MTQMDTITRDSHGDGVNHKLDYMVGNREKGQLVQIATPVQVRAGGAWQSGLFSPIGLGTAAIYADLDAMGARAVAVSVPASGALQGALMVDRDNEGLGLDMWIFNEKPADVTDNSALVVSDADLANVLDVVAFNSFKDANTGQVSIVSGIGTPYTAPDGVLWCLFQSRGAPTIAGGAEPQFRLRILAD